jgi:hypothetical protein
MAKTLRRPPQFHLRLIEENKDDNKKNEQKQ